MFSANRDDHLRDWFSLTSAEYARLCLANSGSSSRRSLQMFIWAGSIWRTHEARAVNETGAVTQIVEIRPSEIGLAVAKADFRISVDKLRLGYPQPPGATPPRDTDRLEIDACAQIDPAAAAAKWSAYPDQWDNDESGGGGPFDPPPGSLKSYSAEITIWDNARAHKIGFLSRANAPLRMESKIDSFLGNTGDESCSVGDWDGSGGANRNMDCGFPCPWNGGDSTDHTPFGLWYA
ncbi:hypothetical protein B0H13DRAFT_1972146 [Mycena leptocephala]|nr:hypothetical protein B0H13DRAFT_1972146 [Mycena leptocephala]